MDEQNLRRGVKLFSPMALALVAGTFAVGCGGSDAAKETPADTVAAAPAAPAAPAGRAVTANDLKTAPQNFVGQTVSVTGMGVASPVGTEAFFLDVPEVPFLVKLPAGQPVPPTGAHVTVSGMMKAMNDSIMNDWITKGLVPEKDRILIEFSTHFIEAQSVQSQP